MIHHRKTEKPRVKYGRWRFLSDTTYPGTALIHFQQVIPNKKLSETVWDNVTGPFWDLEESKQIGFTQNYAKLAAVSAVGGTAMVGAAVGTGTINEIVETRIVIPFGRIFSETMVCGIEKSFSENIVCFDKTCEKAHLQSSPSAKIIEISVKEFFV